MNIIVLKYDSLPSTNTEAAEQARKGAAEGVCIIAREQSAGRGRQGRAWSSKKDSGLYLSIILRPHFAPDHRPLITLLAGIAVFETLKGIGISADIKWVNDIIVRDKKIAGILAEAVETPTGTAIIVGIGINLTEGNSPADDRNAATSIYEETGELFSPDKIAADLTQYLTRYYEMLNTGLGSYEIVREWKERSSYFAGKSIKVTTGNEIFEGITDGLEANGALRVKIADGTLKIVNAGDIERLRAV